MRIEMASLGSAVRATVHRRCDTDALSRLEEIGFRRAGCWVLAAGNPTIVLQHDSAQADVLYAFVSASEVLYVGKTRMPLGRRMYGYQRPGPSQRTNLTCNACIRDWLTAGRSLDVFTRCESGVSQIGSFRVSQAAALGDTIIRELRPPWNRLGK
jgi:hypothetical protein